MVVKVYISGISGNKEVKKRQQRVLMILDSKTIKYEIIDITEPGRESDKDFMQNNSKSNGGTVSDPNPRSPLPPQVFNDEEYCGDYDQFDLANEVDTLEVFLKVEAPPEEPVDDKTTVNGDVIANAETESKENSHEVKENSTEEPSETNEATVDNSSTDAVAKEGSAEKQVLVEETTVVRQKSIEKDQPIDNSEESTEENKEASEKINKESSPAELEAVNENGAMSSREHSEEKEEPDQKKETSSEALIQSEKIAATE